MAGEFGNALFKIQFPPVTVENKTEFGNKYIFTLCEAIDKCPEYLVQQSTLIKLCNEFNLDLISTNNFHEFYHERRPSPCNRDLLCKMHVIDKDGNLSMSIPEWEICGLYRTYIFKKKTGSKIHQTGIPPSMWRNHKNPMYINNMHPTVIHHK